MNCPVCNAEMRHEPRDHGQGMSYDGGGSPPSPEYHACESRQCPANEGVTYYPERGVWAADGVECRNEDAVRGVVKAVPK